MESGEFITAISKQAKDLYIKDETSDLPQAIFGAKTALGLPEYEEQCGDYNLMNRLYDEVLNTFGYEDSTALSRRSYAIEMAEMRRHLIETGNPRAHMGAFSEADLSLTRMSLIY